MWVVALELAGDMLQLALQVHKDIPAGSFPRRKLTFIDQLLHTKSLDFHLISQPLMNKTGITNPVLQMNRPSVQ